MAGFDLSTATPVVDSSAIQNGTEPPYGHATARYYVTDGSYKNIADLPAKAVIDNSGGFDLSTAKPVAAPPAVPVAAQSDASSAPGMLSAALDYFKNDLSQIPQRAGNLAAGAVRGAGSIGATVARVWPNAWGGDTADENAQRRQSMDAALTTLGADPNSIQFKTGKLGAEIAGTAGAGGAIANTLRAIPGVAAGAAPILSAIETGGMASAGRAGVGGQLTRMLGGSLTGSAMAGAVNPEDAAGGALVGGLLPPLASVVGAAARGVGSAYNAITRPAQVATANKLASVLGVSPDALAAAVSQEGPQMIPGYQATVPQIIQSPVTSQLQRTLKTVNPAIGDAERVQQAQYADALNRIAPAATSLQDAANRAGSAIQGYAIPAQQAATQNVRQLFGAVPDAEATMQLPLQAMQDAQTKFLGPGTFGKGGALAEQAMQTAANIGMDAPTMVPKVVPFSQIQALRSSIGEAITQAQAKGQNQAEAALVNMKNAIDNKVADVASGNALPGEVFTPEAVDAWGQALKAHTDKIQQFGTGPQAAMFRMGADGQPVIQGAEIPGKFFNGNRSQVEDMQAFKRLIGNRADLAQEMKSYALTEGQNTANAGGDLTSKFINWMQSRSGANQELFTPQELATVGEVGKAVQRSIDAENLGRVTGSDTAQKLASLNDLGLLNNKLVDVIANKTPFIGKFAGAGLNILRESAAKAQGNRLAQLLADPQALAAALRPAAGNGALDAVMGRALPLTYRVAPVLTSQ